MLLQPCHQPGSCHQLYTPVDEGLLLVCGVELCDEVLEVCNVLLAGAHLLLPLLPHVGVEHTTLCSKHGWEVSESQQQSSIHLPGWMDTVGTAA